MLGPWRMNSLTWRLAGARVGDQPTSGLAISRWVKAAAGKRFAGGVVLYDGEVSASFGDGLFAVPLRALWETE